MKIGWAVHVALTGQFKSIQKVLVGRTEGKLQFGGWMISDFLTFVFLVAIDYLFQIETPC